LLFRLFCLIFTLFGFGGSTGNKWAGSTKLKKISSGEKTFKPLPLN
jgi:hypothetical protein